MEPPGRGGAAGSGARPLAPTPFGARVWAVTQKAPAPSRAPGGGVRLRARRAAGQVGLLLRVRAGSWGCRRRRRRAPRARPAALGARLAERVTGAPGPPGDAAAAAAAAAVAASVGSAGARCGERSVSFGFSVLFLLGRRRREEREGMSAPPRRPRPELGKLERGGAAWRVEGAPFGLWRAGWRGRRGRGERGPGRGEAARERAGGGPWSCVSPERRQSCARGWVSGAALSAAPPSPRMPSGAPVRGSRSRARAARAPPRDGPLAGPLSSASAPPEVVSAVPGPLRGGEGLVEG